MERVAERLPRFKLQRAEATEPVAIVQLCIDPSARRAAIGFYAGSRSLPELRTFPNNDCITVGTIGTIMGTVGTERADCGCNSTIGGTWIGSLAWPTQRLVSAADLATASVYIYIFLLAKRQRGLVATSPPPGNSSNGWKLALRQRCS